ncbi:MAG: hypothetical protein ACHREM_06005 [Polyangiales bacterium]
MRGPIEFRHIAGVARESGSPLRTTCVGAVGSLRKRAARDGVSAR